MKKFLLSPMLILGILFSSASNADVIGVWVGGGLWDWDVSGNARYQSNNPSDTVDVKNDLNWADDDSGTLFAIFEHPVPLIPNVKVFTTSVETSGTGNVNINWGGLPFSGEVNSSLNLDMSDITLYWDLLDNVVGLDLGLNAKILDGKVRLVQAGGTPDVTANFDGTIPMLYAGLDVSLPLTGLMVGANAAAVSYDGNNLSEYHAYIRYETAYVFGVEAGLKSFRMEFDDLDQTTGELEFSGYYANLFLHF